jgi:hypothetical protein
MPNGTDAPGLWQRGFVGRQRSFVTNRTRTIHLQNCLVVREYRIFGIRLKFHSVGERDVPVPMKGLTKAV